MTDPHPYALDVVEGRQPAGSLVRLACERSIAEHAAPPSGWYFDSEFPAAVLRFLGECPHVKSEWAERGERFAPSPWQAWCVSEVYGWRSKSDRRLRRYKEALLEVGKKNGKTFLAAALGLYETAYGDVGAEVFSAARMEKQAKLVWRDACEMLRRLPLEIRANSKQTVQEISWSPQPRKHGTAARFAPVSKEYSSLDGLNPSFVIVDEAAAIDDPGIFGVLRTALGARRTSWILQITTAQRSLSSAYAVTREAAIAMLRGDSDDARTFAAIYAMDAPGEGESLWGRARRPETWIESNPNLDVSVFTDFIETQVAEADRMPTRREEVLLKHFNSWSGSVASWIEEIEVWRAARIDALAREGDCWVGLDLASVRDLTAVARVWSVSRGRFEVDFRCFLPAARLDAVPDSLRRHYDQAIERGTLELTSGEVLDDQHVDAYIDQTVREYGPAITIGYDPYNAQSLVSRWSDRYGEDRLLRVGQGIASLSAPSKQVERLILSGCIAHEGDPFIEWCLENCRAYRDVNDNLKVRRSETEHEKKVDPIVALIVAIAVCDASTEPEAQIHVHRFGRERAPLAGDFDMPGYDDEEWRPAARQTAVDQAREREEADRRALGL